MTQQFHSWVYIPLSKEENSNSKRYIHPSVHCTMFTIAKMRKRLVSTNRWMGKEDVVYTHTHTHTHTHARTHHGILLSRKKEWKFCHLQQSTDGLGRYYAKWKKLDTERQVAYDLTYMWNLKNTRNYCIQQERILTDTENIQWFPVGRGKEGRAI